MVIEETLRLYPPAWGVARETIEEDEVSGYRIPKGSQVAVSQYLAHRHPEFWDNPSTFRPERFAADQSPDRPRYAFFPFGGGPRLCIGNHFAMMELQLTLATLAQRFRVELAPGPPIGVQPLVTLKPDKPVLVKLQLRNA
jgi:cytochrome P450